MHIDDFPLFSLNVRHRAVGGDLSRVIMREVDIRKIPSDGHYFQYTAAASLTYTL